jgi:protein SCO1
MRQNSWRQYVLIVLLLALIGVTAWVLLWWSPTPQPVAHGVLELSAPPQGGDFTLNSLDGPVSLQDLRGKVVLLYFGYTLCPDICPTNLAGMARALDILGEDAPVQGLFISVDPERDTLAHLQDYVKFFHPKLRGLSGDPETLAQIAGLYGAAYQKVEVDSALGYMIDHAAYTYLIDQDGHLREALEHAMPAGEIVEKVRALLALAD